MMDYFANAFLILVGIWVVMFLLSLLYMIVKDI